METLTWRKASRSSANGQCVEIARLPSGDVAVRDSKNPDGIVLRVSANQWARFMGRLAAEYVAVKKLQPELGLYRTVISGE